jgi:hypothetical protein
MRLVKHSSSPTCSASRRSRVHLVIDWYGRSAALFELRNGTRLPRLIGRGRALEVLLGADDIPGELAERYGYVNRSLPDSDLDAFVDGLATRIASFDKQAISETKRFVDVASLPPDFEIAPEWDVCLASIMRPAAQKRIRALMAQGFHKPGDVEKRLGYYVGQVGR